ncbi:glycosyltransferase family 2 protein [Flavobacterium myungsuense]|uniref:Glycosyltransferase family 2 protein n=1 Tax=Flavobacterium myungsuense TaxID=651823 RepID=A0ABW3J050_9FLAO
MSQPLVSVIVTTYNRDEFIERTLISIDNQTYKNIEIIVVDDGSKINYAEKICNKFNNCKYYFKNNGGLASARNYGIKKAKGIYIAFLDDDDLFLPHKIEVQVAILLQKKDIYCVHSSASVIDGNDNLTGEIIGSSKEKTHKRSGNVFWNALGVWVVKSPTPLFRKQVFDKILFDETIKVGEDVDFYQRMFYFFNIYYVNEPLSMYRDNDDSNRLSKKNEKYIGLESKIFSNFIKMGVKNPFTLYKIALQLAKVGIHKKKVFYNKNMKVSNWKLYLNPFYYVMNLDKY